MGMPIFSEQVIVKATAKSLETVDDSLGLASDEIMRNYPALQDWSNFLTANTNNMPGAHQENRARLTRIVQNSFAFGFIVLKSALEIENTQIPEVKTIRARRKFYESGFKETPRSFINAVFDRLDQAVAENPNYIDGVTGWAMDRIIGMESTATEVGATEVGLAGVGGSEVYTIIKGAMEEAK